MAEAKSPIFPVKVYFKEDGSEWILDSEEELGCNLEWFDSRNPEEKTIVTDSNGSSVILVVEKLEVKLFQLG